MASPFADMNDQMLNTKRVYEKFRELYPNDKVIFSSSGFIVKRVFEGDKKKLGFPFYGNHHLGTIVFSNRRLFFWNPRKSAFYIFMKGLYILFLIMIIPLLALLALIMIVSGESLPILLPVGFAVLMIMLPIGILLYQNKEIMLEKRLSDAKKLRVNKMTAMFIKYDMIDHFDGERTIHFASYHAFTENLVRMISALKVGEIHSDH